MLAIAGLGVLAAAAWFFGWSKPARGDLLGLMEVSFAQNAELRAIRPDGSVTDIDRKSVASVGDVRCFGESRRRQPTIHYSCYFDLTVVDGSALRIIIAADYNRGWKRMGMADFGNYRLAYLSLDRQQELLANFGK
jgi:hypothetical protein